MPDPDPTFDTAKDIKTLSDAAWLMFQTSAAKYRQIGLDTWQMAAGEVEPDADKLTKNAIALYATAARDLGNLIMVWQKAANLGAKVDLSTLQGSVVANPAPGGAAGTAPTTAPPPPPAAPDGGG